MNYQSLIASIQAAIYNNGAELITGNVLQAVLLDMVNALDSAGATYGGTINPASAAPADLDQPTVYLAIEAGTYTNYIDSGGNPIVTTGPALIMYDGGNYLYFSKTDLPSGGSGATVVTVSQGNSLVVILPNGDEGIKASYRIDMTAQYTGGSEERYIGSLILEVNDLAMQVAHGYYYGDDMAEILSECAIWQDDPEIYPDEQGYYLLLTTQSDIDEVIFSVSSMDGKSVHMYESNEDEKVKVADATITPVGSGGGDGKMGVISQTQTWSGTGNNPRTYVMSDQVTGLIPQANIDLFESAGATFNESTGYFELNGLTDISYEEMLNIWHRGNYDNAAKSVNWLLQGTTARTNIVTYTQTATGNLPLQQTCGYTELEVFAYANDKVNASHTSPKLPSSLSWTFVASYKLRKFLPFGVNASGVTTAITNAFLQCYSLEDVRFDGLNVNIDFSAAPNFTAASVAYLVEHAGTAAIIIKLHATAYARANADADVQAALSAHTNVSLQSA